MFQNNNIVILKVICESEFKQSINLLSWSFKDTFSADRIYMRFIYLILLLFSSFSATSQIDVHHEPMHRPVLKNKIGRVLDVIAQPGDTSLVHQHRLNYCYVTVSGGQIWIQEKDSNGRNFNLYSGFIGGYYENPDTALVHRFANCDSATVRLIAVENISRYGNPSDSIVQVKARETILVNNSFFVITKVEVKPKEELITQTKRPSVVIRLGPSPIQYKQGKRFKSIDQWIWVDPNQTTTFLNSNDSPATLVRVQLKDRM